MSQPKKRKYSLTLCRQKRPRSDGNNSDGNNRPASLWDMDLEKKFHNKDQSMPNSEHIICALEPFEKKAKAQGNFRHMKLP